MDKLMINNWIKKWRKQLESRDKVSTQIIN